MVALIVVPTIRAATTAAAAEAVGDASADAFRDTPEDGECDDAAEDDAYDYGPFAVEDGQSSSCARSLLVGPYQ